MKYILKNKNTNMYLKYIKSIRFKHYVIMKNEATVFNTTEARNMISKFKHPENWEMIKL